MYTFDRIRNVMLVAALLVSAAAMAGCGDDAPNAPDLDPVPDVEAPVIDQNDQNDQNDDQDQNDTPDDTVLREETVGGPVAEFPTGFTSLGTFTTSASGAITVTVLSSSNESNMLINIALPNGGFATNQVEFLEGSANPATVEIANPQTNLAHALRISDEAGGDPGIEYKVLVTQAAE